MGKFCLSVIIRSWDAEIPIFGFSAFFVTVILEMLQGKECIPNFSLSQVLIF